MFYSKWKRAVAEKNSLLCVGVDPTGTSNKVEWCLGIIRAVAPYAAAVKINRNYVKDLSRNDLKKLTDEIHSYKMLAIDEASPSNTKRSLSMSSISVPSPLNKD